MLNPFGSVSINVKMEIKLLRIFVIRLTGDNTCESSRPVLNIWSLNSSLLCPWRSFPLSTLFDPFQGNLTTKKKTLMRCWKKEELNRIMGLSYFRSGGPCMIGCWDHFFFQPQLLLPPGTEAGRLFPARLPAPVRVEVRTFFCGLWV